MDTAKLVKNPVEEQGFRNAYLRDGRAMVSDPSSGVRSVQIRFEGPVDVMARYQDAQRQTACRRVGSGADHYSLQTAGGYFA